MTHDTMCNCTCKLNICIFYPPHLLIPGSAPVWWCCGVAPQQTVVLLVVLWQCGGDSGGVRSSDTAAMAHVVRHAQLSSGGVVPIYYGSINSRNITFSFDIDCQLLSHHVVKYSVL